LSLAASLSTTRSRSQQGVGWFHWWPDHHHRCSCSCCGCESWTNWLIELRIYVPLDTK